MAIQGEDEKRFGNTVSQMANASRKWSLSRPTSPQTSPHGRAGGQALVGFSPAGTRLAPYYSPGGSLLGSTSSAFAKSSSSSYACRKIRNDISDEEKHEIRMVFELFDSRKSGKLNCRELKFFDSSKPGELNCRELKVALKALNFDVKKEDVSKLIQEYTKGRDDEIDRDEFTEIFTKKSKDRDPNEDLATAFKYFDEDNTGKITLKNLRKIAKDLGENITDDELAAMIDEFDKDGDGEINESEFFGIMKREGLDV